MPTPSRTKASMTRVEMQTMAERRLKAILKAAQALPKLKKMGPKTPRPWTVELNLVGAAAMTRLNGQYRGKHYATDVLSFPAPPVFNLQGLLGELVICHPTLKRQAKERGHSDRVELEVLLVHGVLHLLGMDHELGEKQAAEMARWEKKLLSGSSPGLIARSS